MIPKLSQHDPKPVPKLPQHDLNMIPRRAQKCQRRIPKGFQNLGLEGPMRSEEEQQQRKIINIFISIYIDMLIFSFGVIAEAGFANPLLTELRSLEMKK